jgi:hypothetical protein
MPRAGSEGPQCGIATRVLANRTSRSWRLPSLPRHTSSGRLLGDGSTRCLGARPEQVARGLAANGGRRRGQAGPCSSRDLVGEVVRDLGLWRPQLISVTRKRTKWPAAVHDERHAIEKE